MLSNLSYPTYNAGFSTPFNQNFNQNQNIVPALYIGDLDENVTEADLTEHFSKYGPIFYIRIARDPSTGISKGFGYVNFFNPRDGKIFFYIANDDDY